MEEKKQNSIIIKKKPNPTASLYILSQKYCLCIPSLGDLQNTILKIVLFSQFNKTVTFQAKSTVKRKNNSDLVPKSSFRLRFHTTVEPV